MTLELPIRFLTHDLKSKFIFNVLVVMTDLFESAWNRIGKRFCGVFEKTLWDRLSRSLVAIPVMKDVKYGLYSD